MKSIVAALLINHAPIELKIIEDVAKEYALTDEQTQLLATIRRIENGRDGCEYGIELPEATRYRGNKMASLKLQCQYAAGTIKKRYTGDLKAFANRYCPANSKVWLKNAQYFMNRTDALVVALKGKA
jgi:hypothetical protein